MSIHKYRYENIGKKHKNILRAFMGQMPIKLRGSLVYVHGHDSMQNPNPALSDARKNIGVVKSTWVKVVLLVNVIGVQKYLVV